MVDIGAILCYYIHAEHHVWLSAPLPRVPSGFGGFLTKYNKGDEQ